MVPARARIRDPVPARAGARARRSLPARGRERPGGDRCRGARTRLLQAPRIPARVCVEDAAQRAQGRPQHGAGGARRHPPGARRPRRGRQDAGAAGAQRRRRPHGVDAPVLRLSGAVPDPGRARPRVARRQAALAVPDQLLAGLPGGLPGAGRAVRGLHPHAGQGAMAVVQGAHSRRPALSRPRLSPAQSVPGHKSAGGGSRTHTGFRPPAPKAGVSTVSPRPRRVPRIVRHADRECCAHVDRLQRVRSGSVAQVRNVRPGYAVIHPNRDKAICKLTKLIVVALLIASVVLMMILTIGGWSKLEGMKPVNFLWSAVYLVLAFYILRWARGILPIAAALAILLLIIAVIAGLGLDGTSWFDRNHHGFGAPQSLFGGVGLSPAGAGASTLLLIPVEVALIVFSMIGFAQGWNVETEVPGEEARARATKPIATGPSAATA